MEILKKKKTYIISRKLRKKSKRREENISHKDKNSNKEDNGKMNKNDMEIEPYRIDKIITKHNTSDAR